ncbi:MAG TPA: hypothetical protein VLA67_00770 [Nitrospiraceae bacterium]|nr:hypothetical protein [Nitrospiraceae bacterium]
MKEDLYVEGEEEEVAAALIAFSQSSFALAKLLQRGIQLSDIDRLSIENNLAIVQLHYSVWIRQFRNQ